MTTFYHICEKSIFQRSIRLGCRGGGGGVKLFLQLQQNFLQSEGKCVMCGALDIPVKKGLYQRTFSIFSP
jgi:hypothetical protein